MGMDEAQIRTGVCPLVVRSFASQDLLRFFVCLPDHHLRWHRHHHPACPSTAYREAFHLREHMPTCSRELSEVYRVSAQSRVGRRAFGQPPSDPPRPGRRTPGWRSLVALRPDLVAELHPERNGEVDPEAIAIASHRRLWWRCRSCDHEWQATVTNRTDRGSGCPVCSLQKRARTQSRVPPDRSPATKRPDLMVELHPTRNADLDPRAVGSGSSKKVWWCCRTCGHEWQAIIANRARGAGCPACWQRRRIRR